MLDTFERATEQNAWFMTGHIIVRKMAGDQSQYVSLKIGCGETHPHHFKTRIGMPALRR